MDIPFHLLMLKAYNAQKNKMRPFMQALGLSAGQPKILSFLRMRDGCMQKDLAEYCNIEPATVSRLLNNMEERGLIARRIDDGNRRAVRISITETGKEIERRMRLHFQEVNRISLDGFSEEEGEQFIGYLRRMHENLTARTRDK